LATCWTSWQRPSESLAGQVLAPEGVEAAHPAFDVTPHTLISAIITEQGIVEPPFEKGLPRIMQTADTT
jgi:methylthioribose-1-phosphate isomerase